MVINPNSTSSLAALCLVLAGIPVTRLDRMTSPVPRLSLNASHKIMTASSQVRALLDRFRALIQCLGTITNRGSKRFASRLGGSLGFKLFDLNQLAVVADHVGPAV